MMTGKVASAKAFNARRLIDKVAPNLRTVNGLRVEGFVPSSCHVRAHRARVPAPAVLTPRNLLINRSVQPSFPPWPPARGTPAAFA